MRKNFRNYAMFSIFVMIFLSMAGKKSIGQSEGLNIFFRNINSV